MRTPRRRSARAPLSPSIHRMGLAMLVLTCWFQGTHLEQQPPQAKQNYQWTPSPERPKVRNIETAAIDAFTSSSRFVFLLASSNGSLYPLTHFVHEAGPDMHADPTQPGRGFQIRREPLRLRAVGRMAS